LRLATTLKQDFHKTAFELTENIPVGTYTMVQPPSGGMGRFCFLSKRFLEMTGLDRATAVEDPMKAFACVHPEDHAEWVRKNAHVFEHRLPFCEECRIIVDGRIRWIRAESAPRELPDGSVVWEGVLTDLTAQKEAEEEIARGDKALRHMLDSLPFAVGICVTGQTHRDPKAHIVFVNKQFVNQLGYRVEDIPTVAAWADRAYPDAGYRREVFAWWDAAVRRLASGESTSENHESRVQTKGKAKKDLLISAAPLGNKLIMSFMDMTPHREAEARTALRRKEIDDVGGKLARRQYKVFQLMGRGMGSDQIGREMGISVQTVQSHRKEIAKRLGTSGTELLQRAIRHHQATRRIAGKLRRKSADSA